MSRPVNDAQEPDLSEEEKEMLLAADCVIDDAEQRLAEAALVGDEALVQQREMELKVAFEWAVLVREEIKAGKLR
ncbi:MAG TPA: hypothetical protein VND93_24995 [Myxococcales bacterium]|nr:hypothetical protein [Myxococcales bacterium]